MSEFDQNKANSERHSYGETPSKSATPRTDNAQQISTQAVLLESRRLETELATAQAERDEPNTKLDTILTDVNYEGGLQYWIGKHHEAVMAALSAQALAEKRGEALKHCQNTFEVLEREKGYRSLVHGEVLDIPPNIVLRSVIQISSALTTTPATAHAALAPLVQALKESEEALEHVIKVSREPEINGRFLRFEDRRILLRASETIKAALAAWRGKA